jgi:cytochrome P450
MNASLPALDRFDIVSPEARAAIHRRYREMRAHGPLHRFTDPFSEGPAWVVLSHEGASEVLRDTTTFIRDASLLPGAKPRPPGPPGLEMITGDMVHRDPPEHTRLRRLVNRAFSSRVVDGLRSSVRSIVRELLDAVDSRDDFDLIADFAFPLPVRLICEMLGLPASVLPRLEGWGTDVLADDLPRMLSAANGLRELIDPYIDAREAEATDDLLSHLVHARTVNGERLSRTELHSMSLLLFLAGHETTVNLLSNCVLAILSEDGVRERILADDDACAATIEEVLRYDGPADLASVRYVSVDAELHGLPLAVGDRIFPSLLAANRDPEVFADPDRFDIERDNRASLAFGAGVHSCVGSRLARMEVREALHALFARRPGLALAIDRSELPWKPSRMMHGVLALPVRGR